MPQLTSLRQGKVDFRWGKPRMKEERQFDLLTPRTPQNLKSGKKEIRYLHSIVRDAITKGQDYPVVVGIGTGSGSTRLFQAWPHSTFLQRSPRNLLTGDEKIK